MKKLCSERWFVGVGGMSVVFVLGSLNLSRFLGLVGVVVVTVGGGCACLLI